MLRTELGRLSPQLKDLPWPLRGEDRWESAPYSVDDMSETHVG
jgi:hypothetical protein